jgi:hypothetical protein
VNNRQHQLLVQSRLDRVLDVLRALRDGAHRRDLPVGGNQYETALRLRDTFLAKLDELVDLDADLDDRENLLLDGTYAPRV